MEPEVRVAFTLTGLGIDPDVITEGIGLRPTKTWRLGEKNQNTKVRRKYDGWSIVMKRHRSADLGQEIRRLLEPILPHANAIRKTCEEYDLEAEVGCAVYVSDETPAMYLDSDIIKLLADLNAEFDIDLYILPPEALDEE